MDKKGSHFDDSCDRVEVERKFSLAKRNFGLGILWTYLKKATESVATLSILALNLSKILCAPIYKWIYNSDM